MDCCFIKEVVKKEAEKPLPELEYVPIKEEKFIQKKEFIEDLKKRYKLPMNSKYAK